MAKCQRIMVVTEAGALFLNHLRGRASKRSSRGRIMNGPKIKYTSGWFTVIFPTLEFLLIWLGLSALFLARLHWNAPILVALLIFGGSLVVSLVVCVWTYPLLLKMAERGRGELGLEGNTIKWKLGSRWRRIDLGQPYRATLRAGYSGLGRPNASIDLRDDRESLVVHLKGAWREDVLRYFPHRYFVGELALTPQEGLWGFVLDAADPPSAESFFQLASTLWATRENNELFLMYRKFPWDTIPRPAFRVIKAIDPRECSEREWEFLATLKSQIVSCPVPWLAATPDYLLGYQWGVLDELKDLVSSKAGEPSRYFVMPLGYVHAETLLPRPDLETFLIGHLIVTALGGSSAIPLRDKHLLRIQGIAENGQPMRIAFEWCGPADDKYEECEAFVRFVNR